MPNGTKRASRRPQPWRNEAPRPPTPKTRSAEEGFAAIVKALGDRPGVTKPASGRGFGSSALRVHGRIFAMVSRGRLVLKMPAQRVAQLIGSRAGDSYDAGKGRPIKEWVSFGAAKQDDWLVLAAEALKFVGSGSG